MTTLAHREVGVTITSVLTGDPSDRRYEPEPSTRLFSVREMWKRPEHIQHRFSFNGAITHREVVRLMLVENLTATNSAWARVLNTPMWEGDK